MFIQSIVNLLFVPIITIFIDERDRINSMQPNLMLLVKYCLIVVFNMVIANVFSQIWIMFTEVKDMATYSVSYTVTAIFSAILLAELIKLYRCMIEINRE